MSTTSFVMPNDLSDLCRVCLQLPEESQYLDLTTIYDEDDNLTYGECFTICTQIDLSAGVGVPHNLCKTCGLELQMSYDFHKKIEESKRVIEQCQRQIAQEKECSKEILLQTNEDSHKLVNAEEVETDNGLQQFIDHKYVISEDEMEMVGTSQELEAVESIRQQQQHKDLYEYENDLEEQTDDIEVLNKMCQNDASTSTGDGTANEGNIEEHNRAEDDVEHLDVVDFQNMEALEEEDLSNLNFNKDYNKCEIQEQEIITSTTITPYVPSGIRLQLPKGPPYICELCGHSSNTKSLLASHRHRKHRHKEPTYQCHKCDKTFKTKESYEKHITRLSCDIYPEFICEYCSKKIIGSANYDIHLRFHQKIYPFKCTTCGKGFMLAIHLKNHTETKHENKRYICEVSNCGKLFQSQQSLKFHMYAHSGLMPYSCEYCDDKNFPSKGKLRYHIRNFHGLEMSLKDLERMMVAEEIIVKAKVKPVEFNN